MSIEIETRKETNKLVKWKIAIPRVGSRVKSVFFSISDGKLYFFTFEATIDFKPEIPEELWTITLHKSKDNKNDSCFPLIVSIRHKGKDFYLCTKEIDNYHNVVWSSSCNKFQKKYPSIEVAGTNLQFVFDFHLRTPDTGISVTEEKSAQMSDTKVETKYPESHPCLENLSLDLSKLIDDGTDTDVLVKCGDVSIGAHKVILGARSEVFRTMMQTDMVEGREGIVEISDMEPKILKIFIQYIYTGILPDLTADTALPIYEAADKYQVEALKKRSGHLLVKNLSPENALTILVTADAHNDTNLKDRLVSYISEEKIPNRKEEWLKFCNEYPKLANEVFNFMFFK